MAGTERIYVYVGVCEVAQIAVIAVIITSLRIFGCSPVDIKHPEAHSMIGYHLHRCYAKPP